MRAAPELELCIRKNQLTTERWEGAFYLFPSMHTYTLVTRTELLQEPALSEWSLGLLGDVPDVARPAEVLALPPEKMYETVLRAMLRRFGFATCGYWPRWVPDEFAEESMCERAVLAYLWQAPIREVQFFAEPTAQTAGLVCELRLHMLCPQKAVELCSERLALHDAIYRPRQHAA